MLQAAAPAPKPLDAQALQDALALAWHRLRFPRALEQQYHDDTGAGRGNRVLACTVLGTLTFSALSALDAARLPHMAATLDHLRWMAMAFFVLLIGYQFVSRKSSPAWHRDAAVSAGALLMSAYAIFVGHNANTVITVMNLGVLALIMMFASLMARLQFFWALIVNVLTVVGYAAFAHDWDTLTLAIVQNHNLLLPVTSAVTLAGCYMLELRERRAYLLLRLKLDRARALAAGAEAVRHQALSDALTGLANRRHFDAEIAAAWTRAKDTGSSVALLQIDIDFFKRYNDHYGHPMGDLCLKQVAASLRDVAGHHQGLAARMGGEEFALLLPDAGLAQAEAAAQAACAAVRALKVRHAQSAVSSCVTISVGVAVMQPAAENDPSTLTSCADRALYRAKEAGRDRHAVSVDTGPTMAGAAAPPTIDPMRVPDLPELGPPPGEGLVQRLEQLLAGSLRRLRFPADLETEYQEHDKLTRLWLLTVLFISAMGFTAFYVAFNRTLFPDIADETIHAMTGTCAAMALVWALFVCTKPSWRWREGVFTGLASTLGLVLILLLSRSHSPGMHSAMLPLSLISVVASVLAVPPFRFGLVPALTVCGGLAWLGYPDDIAQRALWGNVLAILCLITSYALIANYQLDLANRRNYLLQRLSDAQLAGLAHQTQHLQRLALIDPLTRLPNRRHFESQLTQSWRSCMATPRWLSLLIIDIDHFKKYNDRYGHPAGDACLQRVSGVLTRWASDAGGAHGELRFLSRMGGEEFGVLLTDENADAALASAQDICALLGAQRIEHAASPVAAFLTVSIGAASMLPAGAVDVRDLLKVADEALYRAKASGRNRAVV